MRILSALGAAMLAFVAATPALADAQDKAVRTALSQLQAKDARVQNIGWKLITGNAAFCPATRPAIGLLLQDLAGYSQPDMMRRVAGSSSDIAVQAVVPGSPADTFGITPNMAIFFVAGEVVHNWPRPENGYERLRDINRLIDTALVKDTYVPITWRESPFGAVRVETFFGVPACASRFEVLTDSKAASANAERVAIGENFVGFTYSDDMFAAAIAHELAHVVLGHYAWLDANGRKQRNIRQTEREADRLMPWLLANAGYDPETAVRFMRFWGPDHDAGIFRARTHDGWDERTDFIAAELPAIRKSMADSNGAGIAKADWAAQFTREITP